jgi:pimeloyl-ACP methyl ester carboxylesterase
MSPTAITAAADVPVATALLRLAQEGRPGWFDAGRYMLRYAAWGSGPPIVFVHGIADVARSFAMVAADLSQHFTCVLYELPSGDGDHARLGAYRHGDYADDLIRLLDHLLLERTYVLGSSFGSTIVLRALANHPQRFARAVLQGGFARRRVGPHEVALARFARYWKARMRSMPVRTALRNPRERAVFDSVPPDRARFMADNCGSVPIAAVARIGLLIAKLDLRPILSTVRLPVRLIGGDRDSIIAPQYEQELLKGLPNAERIEIPDCGHLPQYTHPGLLAELMRQFFTPDCHDTCEHP